MAGVRYAKPLLGPILGSNNAEADVEQDSLGCYIHPQVLRESNDYAEGERRSGDVFLVSAHPRSCFLDLMVKGL